MGNVAQIHDCKRWDYKGAQRVLWEANCNAD